MRDYAKKLKSIETAARNLRIENLLRLQTGKTAPASLPPTRKTITPKPFCKDCLAAQVFAACAESGPPKNLQNGVRFIRPLLCATRGEIIQYLNSRNLKWCTDRTNEDFAYRRNFIRHRLLPALQKDCDGCLVDELSELTKASRGFYRFDLSVSRRDLARRRNCGKTDRNTGFGQACCQPTEVKVEIIRRAYRIWPAANRKSQKNITVTFCDCQKIKQHNCPAV